MPEPPAYTFFRSLMEKVRYVPHVIGCIVLVGLFGFLVSILLCHDTAAADSYYNVVQTDFPARAELLADEIGLMLEFLESRLPTP